MRTYYRGPEALVTDRQFVRLGSAPVMFELSDLHNVFIVGAERRLVSPLVVAGGGLVVSVLSVVVAASIGDAAFWVVAAMLSVVALGFTWQAVRRPPPCWELRATYRGTEVTIFSTPDARVFHQVARALRRAIEDGLPRVRDSV